MDATRFVTEYGSHLGMSRYFLVIENDYMIDSRELTKERMRDSILEGTPYLHQSLMTDAERDHLYKEYF